MIQTAKELAAAAAEVAKNHKTLYVMGCFGAPMNAKNKKRYSDNHKYNKQPARTAMIQNASDDTFGFDCVCLIKGLLWGWDGDKAKTYGGAKYKANGVPDISADQLIKQCRDVSTDFGKIEVGEVVHTPGHVGIYIGDGLAVECTPSWENKVQITAVGNIGKREGYNTRTWTQHGKLPWVSYEEIPQVTCRVYAGGKWLPEVTGVSDYAGVFGKEITDIQVQLSDGQAVTVLCHTCSGWTGDAMDCVAMKAEGCKLKYRVHVLGGKWLPWVTGFDLTDLDHGFAGVYGKAIDAVQIDVQT